MKEYSRTLSTFLVVLVLISTFSSCTFFGGNNEEAKPDSSSETQLRTTDLPQSETESVSQTEQSDRDEKYDGELWLEKSELIKERDSIFNNDALSITDIYSDCFFATPVIPLPYDLKINGSLSDEWKVGDHIECELENVYWDRDSDRVEADLVNIERSDFRLDPDKAYKPVIYLYPEEKTEVSVKLDLRGDFTCTYPAYENGWEVTALPDGTLFDRNGQSYNYLYWEGDVDIDYDLSEGSCVKGADTASFLEKTLAELGLTRKEANEFIVFWLPQMQNNAYNVISFQTESYESAVGLCVSPAADATIRVFMAWYPVTEYVDISPQSFDAPERNGFTVVEWGGALVG